MYRLNYAAPTGDVVIDSGKIHLEHAWVQNWLDNLVELYPDTIFFLTTETTDIF